MRRLRAYPGRDRPQPRDEERYRMAAPHEQGEVIASRRGFFWVGVDERIETPVGHTNRGAMYVEWEAPETVTQPVPIILVHGGGGQGTDYLGTPDGRPGWWPQLVQEGWAVYAVDRPAVLLRVRLRALRGRHDRPDGLSAGHRVAHAVARQPGSRPGPGPVHGGHRADARG